MALSTEWLQNVTYPARIDRMAFDNLWTEGILGAGSFAVSPSSPAAMTVQVAAGVAVITGDDQAFQGKYLTREQAATTGLAIGAAPGSGQRNDLVVIQVRDPNAGGAAGDDAIIRVVAGTPSGSPVDPAVPNSALVLARVRVPAGTGSITAGLIDDLRTTSYSAHDMVAPGSITVADLDPSAIAALTPTGTVVQYAGAVAPSGWLLCDGTSYAQATYPALYAVVGSSFDTSAGQASPGAGNFRVPILKGRVPVGLDGADVDFATIGNTGGAKTVTLSSAEMPSHTHTQNSHTHTQNSHTHTTSSNGSHTHTLDILGSGSPDHVHYGVGSSTYASGQPVGSTYDGGADSGQVNSGGTHDHTANSTTATNQSTTPTNQNTGGGGAHNNVQPYLVLQYIIKT